MRQQLTSSKLVCQCGNELVQNATYTNETYSPTVAHLTHSTMLQLAIYVFTLVAQAVSLPTGFAILSYNLLLFLFKAKTVNQKLNLIEIKHNLER